VADPTPQQSVGLRPPVHLCGWLADYTINLNVWVGGACHPPFGCPSVGCPPAGWSPIWCGCDHHPPAYFLSRGCGVPPSLNQVGGGATPTPQPGGGWGYYHHPNRISGVDSRITNRGASQNEKAENRNLFSTRKTRQKRAGRVPIGWVNKSLENEIETAKHGISP
jgi:hypothetical protein